MPKPESSATQKKSVSKGSVNQRRISAAEKQARALNLRKAGYTFEQIAEDIGYASPSGASKAVYAALKKTIQEPADELRKIELERLDVMLKSLWPFVLKGSPRHVEIALKIMDRRTAFLGLDAPTQVEDHRTVTIHLLAEQMAERSGFDKDEVIAEAERIIAEAAVR